MLCFAGVAALARLWGLAACGGKGGGGGEGIHNGRSSLKNSIYSNSSQAIVTTTTPRSCYHAYVSRPCCWCCFADQLEPSLLSNEQHTNTKEQHTTNTRAHTHTPHTTHHALRTTHHGTYLATKRLPPLLCLFVCYLFSKACRKLFRDSWRPSASPPGSTRTSSLS